MNKEINWHIEPVVASPAEEVVYPVTLAEARDHLRLDATGSPAEHEADTYVQSLIAAVTKHIDGNEGWLKRSLITKTYDLVFDRFPTDYITVPLPPLQSITSITYIDQNGDSQVLATDRYTISRSNPARVYRAYNTCFPVTRCQPDAVRMRFIAGYGDEATDIPEPIRQAILMMIGHYYENRESVVIGDSAIVMPMAVDTLLSPYRMYGW